MIGKLKVENIYQLLANIILSVIVLGVALVVGSSESFILCCLICIIIFFITCFKNLTYYFLCAIFGISCFSFLFGSILFDFDVASIGSLENFKKYCLCIVFLFIGLQFGMFLGSAKIKNRYFIQINEFNSNISVKQIFKTASLIFWFTIPIRIIYIFLRIRVALTYGYVYLYYHPDLFLVGKYSLFTDINSINKICFLLMLSTLPKLSEMHRAMFAVLICDVLLLFSGVRADLLKTILLIISIWFLRKYPYSGIKISRFERNRILFILSVGIIIMATIFSLVVGIRTESNFSLPSNPIKYIIAKEGNMWNLVMDTISIYDRTTIQQHLGFYFSPLIKTVTLQFLLEKLGIGLLKATPYTSVYAEKSFDYSHYYTYYTNPNLYLSGGGLGSSFLAESYFLGKYFGVFLHAVLVGFILTYFSYHPSKSIWKNLYMLTFINGVFWSARASALMPFFSFFSFSMLMSVVIIKIASKFYIVKK